eukprot:SAG22_NODE_862_length_6808_cov_3.881204_3_plen_180_part_00
MKGESCSELTEARVLLPNLIQVIRIDDALCAELIDRLHAAGQTIGKPLGGGGGGGGGGAPENVDKSDSSTQIGLDVAFYQHNRWYAHRKLVKALWHRLTRIEFRVSGAVLCSAAAGADVGQPHCIETPVVCLQLLNTCQEDEPEWEKTAPRRLYRRALTAIGGDTHHWTRPPSFVTGTP